MRRAHAHVSSAADRATLARDHAVLAALAAEPGASQQALAERLEINRTIMVKLVDRLQAAGFVTRTRNPEDRRSYLLALTGDGREALAGMEPAVRERDRFLTAALTDAEYERLNELLRAVLGEPEKTPGTASTEYLVGQVYFLLRRRGDALVADEGLRIRNFAALRMIDKLGPCPQQQVARALGLGEPAAALVVDELVDKGLVVRGQDPGDRRRYALELTDLGRERLVRLAEAIRRVQAEVTAGLGGPERVAELHALVLRVLGLSPEGLEL
jgi:DNA-binding MarR family transcriptional regulator